MNDDDDDNDDDDEDDDEDDDGDDDGDYAVPCQYNDADEDTFTPLWWWYRLCLHEMILVMNYSNHDIETEVGKFSYPVPCGG